MDLPCSVTVSIRVAEEISFVASIEQRRRCEALARGLSERAARSQCGPFHMLGDMQRCGFRLGACSSWASRRRADPAHRMQSACCTVSSVPPVADPA